MARHHASSWQRCSQSKEWFWGKTPTSKPCDAPIRDDTSKPCDAPIRDDTSKIHYWKWPLPIISISYHCNLYTSVYPHTSAWTGPNGPEKQGQGHQHVTPNTQYTTSITLRGRWGRCCVLHTQSLLLRATGANNMTLYPPPITTYLCIDYSTRLEYTWWRLSNKISHFWWTLSSWSSAVFGTEGWRSVWCSWPTVLCKTVLQC